LRRQGDLTLGTLFDRLAEEYGDRCLVEEAGGGLRLTFRQGAEAVSSYAEVLRSKIGPGDRVVVGVPNGYAILLLCAAVTRAGGVAVPVNPKMSDAEIDHVVEDSAASMVLRTAPVDVSDAIGTGTSRLLEDAPSLAQPEDVAVLFYTSGTTGKPKGAELTHRGLVGAVSGLMTAGALLSPVRQEALSGLPVAHIAGFSALVQMAGLGVSAYLLPHFRPDDALDAIESRRITIVIGVPAMFRMMLDAGAEKRDLRSVRLWSSGADVMPDDLARTFQRMGGSVTLPLLHRTVGQAAFVDGYGMVELGGGVATRVFPPGPPLPIKPMVRAMPGNKLRVVDDEGHDVRRGHVGELMVKGRSTMRGYHGQADETAAAMDQEGWLRTGDLGRQRWGGFFEFAGRKKDVIKHGGYSVFAVEVEQALGEHPAVAEAAVIGIPDARKGEIPAAVVLLEPGAEVTEDDLIGWARERLADYKVPRQVRFVDELPRTGTEKVRKASLKDLFQG
jgi:acyl-CoA synthetase (AMP-forming)/AMP-acid ligase II